MKTEQEIRDALEKAIKRRSSLTVGDDQVEIGVARGDEHTLTWVLGECEGYFDYGSEDE